ncbi:hypothetical protein GCM10009106_03090 [Sphingomonas japonica]
MAMQRMKGFGWFLTGVIVAPGCYLVSSQVAAERARVQSVERAIAAAEADIRALETEFGTRANLAQLERWNGDVLALVAPRPDQFVQGEMGLAALHAPKPGEAGYRVAAYVVPSGVPDLPAPLPAAPKAEAVELASNDVARPRPVVAAAATPRPDKAQAVAMLDDALLSENTLGDILKGARREAVSGR